MNQASTPQRFLRWEKEGRCYEAHLHQDLWNDWVITRAWGAKGAKLSRIVHDPVISYAAGLARLEAINKRRLQRGYRLIRT